MWLFAMYFKEIMTLHGPVHLGLQPTNRSNPLHLPQDNLRPRLAPMVCLLPSNPLTDIYFLSLLLLLSCFSRIRLCATP